MSELTAKDLKWFQLANACPAPGFYAFKKRFLQRFAVPDGFDLQRVPKMCRVCDGSGYYLLDVECRSCGGDGIHHVNEHWLQRWDLAGTVYHVPLDHADVYHLHGFRYPEPRREIEGLIAKGTSGTGNLRVPVSAAVGQRAYWRLLVRHEPMAFYRSVMELMQWRGKSFRTKWYFRLIRLRNKLDLFRSVPEHDEVPF